MSPEFQENINNIRTMTRFHFIAGLPNSGAGVLSALLSQNPRFVANGASAAGELFAQMVKMLSEDNSTQIALENDQKVALWRGIFHGIYHDRPIDSVVFDYNLSWLNYIDLLAQLFPLSRFILCVRNPAVIANSLEVSATIPDLTPGDINQKIRLKAMFAADGPIGANIHQLRRALKGPHTERMLVIDYDRLVDDPEEVLDVVYDFMREPDFGHDFQNLSLAVPNLTANQNQKQRIIEGAVRRRDHKMVLTPRMIQQLSGRAFWRNLRRTNATMMLGRA